MYKNILGEEVDTDKEFYAIHLEGRAFTVVPVIKKYGNIRCVLEGIPVAEAWITNSYASIKVMEDALDGLSLNFQKFNMMGWH